MESEQLENVIIITILSIASSLHDSINFIMS